MDFKHRDALRGAVARFSRHKDLQRAHFRELGVSCSQPIEATPTKTDFAIELSFVVSSSPNRCGDVTGFPKFGVCGGFRTPNNFIVFERPGTIEKGRISPFS